MAADYIDTMLEGEARIRYRKKLTVIGSECPYRIPADRWENKPTEWPNVQYPDIYHYLIETPGVHTREAMKNYKSLRSYNLLIAGWVQPVLHIRLPNGLFLFKTSVQRSYNLSEAPHTTWASANASGGIVTAHCTCKAGLGETCTHVGALLMKIEMTRRIGASDEACTDKPCIWNAVCTKGVPSSTIADISFYGEKAKKCAKRKLPTISPSENAKKEFLAELLKNEAPPVCLSMFESTGGNFVSQKPVPKRTKMPQTLKDVDLSMAGQKLQPLSEEEIDYVERMTRSQHTSMTWHDQRAGRITSCRAHAVRTSRQEHPAKLIHKICSGKPQNLDYVPIVWGRTHEKDGFTEYEKAMKPKHENFELREAGLHIHRTHSYIAASPDGVVNCECCGHGVIEIKCPHKFRDIHPDKIQGYSFGKDSKMKTNHEHYTQVQHHLLVTTADYCDYVIWTKIDISVTRVYPDHALQATLVAKYALFWEKHLQPELATGSFEKAEEAKEDNKENMAIHCSCGFKDKVPMVGCDGKNCPHEWFHYDCVGLTKAPTTKTWYCPVCSPKSLKL